MIPTHISFSQYKAYTDCPRSWYLGKVAQAEEKQTWFLPIGTAVHQMIEDRLLDDRPSDRDGYAMPEDYFYPLVARQMEIEPDTSKWLAGGPKDDPVVEDKALALVASSFLRAQEFLADLDVWHIELDVTGPLPGLDVEVKAFVDIIGEHKKHGPIIGDWKTGKTKPKDNFQLETYKALTMGMDLGSAAARIAKGWYIMLNPDASQARPVDLSQVDPATMGAKYQKVYQAMKDRIYKTDHGFKCRFCFHQDNCLLNAGPTDRAKFYDKASEEGYPF